MKLITKIFLLSVVFLFSSLMNISFADDEAAKPVKFELKIKPNQQYAQIKLEDGDKFIKTFNAKAEFVKLNPTTNNYHIKVTFSNNGIATLYHQLAIIEEVENAEIKYPDSTTDYTKSDDGKQITKTLPYYNYGNIKLLQSTPREWYISNTGKEEIEVKGYIISKEIPIIIDTTKITDLGAAATLRKFLTGLRDNDLDMVLSAVAGPKIYYPKDLHKTLITYHGYTNEYFPFLYYMYKDIRNVGIFANGNQWQINSWWIDPEDGSTNGTLIALDNFGNQYGWLIIEY